MNFDKIEYGSNFILAGVQTLPSLFNHIVPQYASKEDISNFLDRVSNKYLLSFGEALSYKNPKLPPKHLEHFLKKLDDVWYNSGYFDKSLLWIDSGGFQISMGGLPKKDVEKYTDMYCQLISKHGDYVFSMDVPPNASVFDNYDEIYDLNKFTYNKLASLPENIIEKILCVFHFRTVDLYKAWNKIFEDCQCWDRYKIFSIGGLVGSGMLPATENIVPYVIPIDKIVRQHLSRNRKEVYIHILGSTTSYDFLFYDLLKRIYKEQYGISLYMTFDSSKLFKGIIKGKYFEIVREGQVHKIVYKSIEQNRKLKGVVEGKSAIDLLKEEIDEISSYGIIKHDDFDDMYDFSKENYPMKQSITAFLTLQTIKNSRDLFILTENYAKELYDIFNKDNKSFVSETTKVLKNLNGNKLTDNIRGKSVSLLRSLEFIRRGEKDEKVYEDMIGKVFGKREIQGMQNVGVLEWT